MQENASRYVILKDSIEIFDSQTNQQSVFQQNGQTVDQKLEECITFINTCAQKSVFLVESGSLLKFLQNFFSSMNQKNYCFESLLQQVIYEDEEQLLNNYSPFQQLIQKEQTNVFMVIQCNDMLFLMDAITWQHTNFQSMAQLLDYIIQIIHDVIQNTRQASSFSPHILLELSSLQQYGELYNYAKTLQQDKLIQCVSARVNKFVVVLTKTIQYIYQELQKFYQLKNISLNQGVISVILCLSLTLLYNDNSVDIQKSFHNIKTLLQQYQVFQQKYLYFLFCLNSQDYQQLNLVNDNQESLHQQYYQAFIDNSYEDIQFFKQLDKKFMHYYVCDYSQEQKTFNIVIFQNSSKIFCYTQYGLGEFEDQIQLFQNIIELIKVHDILSIHRHITVCYRVILNKDYIYQFKQDLQGLITQQNKKLDLLFFFEQNAWNTQLGKNINKINQQKYIQINTNLQDLNKTVQSINKLFNGFCDLEINV